MRGFLVSFVLVLLSVLAVLRECSCSTRQQKLLEFGAKLRGRAGLEQVRSLQALKQDGRVFYPIAYGADPSGQQDSTEAILNALNDAFEVQSGEGMIHHLLLPGVNDLGGVVIDLQGGEYKISKPIRFPAIGGGNVLVKAGTFRASDTFPGDRHLIELWSPHSPLPEETKDFNKNSDDELSLEQQNIQDSIYYEAITFRDILFDSSFRGGGIFIIDSARIRINNCYFIHFTTQGILVQRGHEAFISSCFFGEHETVGGNKDEKDFSGTGIEFASNDNAISDVVVFSGAIGILIRGQANVVTGAHCYNKATKFGGVGILVKSGGSLNRINGCYLDYNSIVIEDPFQVSVTNGLFFAGANIVLKSINGQISRINIVDNIFSGLATGNVPIVELDGQFRSIGQVVVDRNNAKNMQMKSTVGKLTVRGKGCKWEADFSSALVFPNRIEHFQYSVQTAGYVMHAVTSISDNKIVVESSEAVDATVSVTVEQ
ncbi:hypothetical protein K2173_000359 [Erythroxylum novogranatense]|uniref:Pectin lyase-like superfamily protein n=1 Tax=Erythroxylum novogranatense TaxID=1862640 RepID=A0AAV8SWC7_9ROSI|nr:hypothetical protein K2173_000359 [Erythroxylum novogranatense]